MIITRVLRLQRAVSRSMYDSEAEMQAMLELCKVLKQGTYLAHNRQASAHEVQRLLT